MSKLDTQTETQIVAMIARGDTYEGIQRVLAGRGDTISISTISAVKKRNSEALEYMKGLMVEQSVNQSTKILAKSRELIERRVDNELRRDEEIDALKEKHNNGEIDDGDFYHYLDSAIRGSLTISELTSLTREMFNQSQVEQGKPTTISDNPTQAKENLRNLLEAINDKDETAMLKALFDVKS